MKTILTTLTALCGMLFFSSSIEAQNNGDYRSNRTSMDYSWFVPANWLVYNSGTSTWETATNYPTSSDGVITIFNTDSLVITGATPITIDQVQIASGAKLSIFGGTFALADGTGDEISVLGKLYLGSNGILEGTGSINVSSTGTLTVRNNARLKITTVNAGTTVFSGNAYIQDANFTNNGTINWLNNYLILNTATLTNNGTLNMLGDQNRFFNSGPGTPGTLINSSTGVLYKESATSVITFIADAGNANFINSGTIRGFGLLNLQNISTNNGTLSPGNSSPGTLTVNPSAIDAKPVSINIRILNSGGPGVGYDKVLVNGSGNVDLSSASLTIIDNPAAPANTTYTIMEIINTGFPNFVNNFLPANVHIPAGYGNLTVTSQTVTIDKLEVLPVIWGNFTAQQKGTQVALQWSTLQESNTSRFVAERSTDGQHFSTVGSVQAVGNSSVTTNYTFSDNTPTLNSKNYYRIAQIDLDGKSSYSVTRAVSLGSNTGAAVKIGSNPVVNGVLDLIINNDSKTQVILTNMAGLTLRNVTLQPGSQQINISNLPAGIYQVSIYQNQSKIISQRIIKN